VIKKLSIFLGALLWGLGADLNVSVAIGKYGLIAFFAGAVLAAGLLIRKGFQENQSNKDLWILIFRGLAVEALLFPIANLIMEYLLLKAFPYDETRALLIQSGLIAVILATVFLFNAHLLNTKIRLLHTRLEERKLELNKESMNKKHEK
jgi:hypothetical protein